MKTKLIMFALALFLAATTAGTGQAQGNAEEGGLSGGALAANMGTWKLNEKRSHIAKGGAKNHTVTYEKAGDMDSVKVTVDGTDASGNSTHSEWTGKVNGVYYAVTGDPLSDMRMYDRVNKRTLSITGKKDGKVVMTGTIAVSPNGKMRTVTTRVLNAQGTWSTTTAVYDKQ
jgi:hypothetical protein